MSENRTIVKKKVFKKTLTKPANDIILFTKNNNILRIPTEFIYITEGGKKKKVPCYLNKIKYKGEYKFSPNMGVPFYKWTKAMVKSHCEFLKKYDKLNSCDGVIVILYNTKWIMIDTDDEEGEIEISKIEEFKTAPITHSLTKKYGRHRYIQLEKTGNYVSNYKINGKEIDIITEYVFEGRGECANILENKITKIDDFNRLLNIKMVSKDLETLSKNTKKININLDRKFKNIDVIRNTFLNEDEVIPEKLLMKLLGGLKVENYKDYKKWFCLLCGIFNQALDQRQNLLYKMAFMEFMGKGAPDGLLGVWERENDATWSQLSNNQPEIKVKSGSLWRFLKEDNLDLFIELKGQRRQQIDPATFNLLKKYQAQKERFERDCWVIKGEKPTYCEKDHITDEIKERSIDNFKQNFCNLKTMIAITDKKGNTQQKATPFIEMWINDDKRKEYDRMDFIPTALDKDNKRKSKVNEYTYNLFDGLYIDDLENEEFDNTDEKEREEKIEKILAHLYYLVGCDEDCYSYLLKILAFKYKYPAKLHKIACVFKSKQGCGKNAFLDWFGEKVLGKPYYCCSSNPDDFVGKFNSQIKGKLMIVFNEMDGAVGYKEVARLKEFATEETITHEKKGIDRCKIKNCALTMFASNNENPVKVEIGDRRFFVVECSDRVLYIENYFEDLFEDLEDPCIAKCFCWYLVNKVSVEEHYNFKANRPFTRAYKELQNKNKPVMVKFIEYLIGGDLVSDEDNFTTTQLWDLFVEYQEYYKVKSKWDFKGFNDGINKYIYTRLDDLGDRDTDKVIHKFKSNKLVHRFNKIRCQYLIDLYDLDKDLDYEEEYEEIYSDDNDFED